MAKIVFDSEKELENLIVSKLELNKHCPITDEQVDAHYQQLSLGSYGITDIVTVKFDLDSGGLIPIATFTVIEVKKETINSKSHAQIARYLVGLDHILTEADLDYDFTVEGVLVAPSIQMDDDSCFLSEAVGAVTIYTVSCDLDTGVSFKEQSGWRKESVNLPEDTVLFLDITSVDINRQFNGTPF